MKLELFILTRHCSKEFLTHLMSLLLPQLNSNNCREVDFKIAFFDEGHSLGENRERMRRAATGDYVAFLDDDDLIAPNFISSILPLLNGVDQVSFDVHMFHNGKPLKMARHSLEHSHWH